MKAHCVGPVPTKGIAPDVEQRRAISRHAYFELPRAIISQEQQRVAVWRPVEQIRSE
jgi:hypothetical protein